MHEVTKLMIKDFNIKKLGYDFMGYKVNKNSSLSFHHLIYSKSECERTGFGHGYEYWNGAILVQDTSHDYLHIIEQHNRRIFEEITIQMLYQKLKGHLDKENLIEIRKLLLAFEKSNSEVYTKKGKRLIKDIYISDRVEEF